MSLFLKDVDRETLELKEKYEVLSRDEIKIKLKAGCWNVLNNVQGILNHKQYH